MPDRPHPQPTQRRVTDTDSDSKSSTTDGAHTGHRKRIDSTHKKHPLGHKAGKPRLGPRSSSSRQVTQTNKDKEEKETRRYSADMDDVSPKNMANIAVFGTKDSQAGKDKEAGGGGSTMGSKSEWDDVVDLDGLKAKALEREASALSLQGLNLAQQRKTTGGMRRNRSAAEMAKRRLLLGHQEKHTVLKKSASHTSVHKAHVGHKDQGARTSVHFDLGREREKEAEEGDDDGWTEASGSASPNLSRSGSVAGNGSGRNSARGQSKTNSEAPSMSTSPERSRTESRDWSRDPTASPSRRESHSHNGGAAAAAQARHPDATQITTRLLQRVASHSAAPQMSAVSATALPSTTSSFSNGHGQKDSTGRSQPTSDAGHSSDTATPHDLPSELISRFKGSGPGTPGESPSPYHSHLGTPAVRGGDAKHNKSQSTQQAAQGPSSAALDNSRRAKSMSNLNQKPKEDDSEDERPLNPRSRKSSTAAYAAPPQSRTQQKLWLQRASSNIESAQPSSLGLNLALNGLGAISVLDADGLGGGDGNALAKMLVGSLGVREGEFGRDGRGDPRVRVILEKTGMTYRAVGRFVDPVVRSLRRLEVIPGSHRRAKGIPNGKGKKAESVRGTKEREGAGGKGLSQSLKDARGGGFLDRSRKSMDAVSGKNGAQARSFEKEGQGSLGSDRTEAGSEEDEVRMLLRGLWESNVERSPRNRGEIEQ